MPNVIASLIRQGLTVAGGSLVTQGLTDTTQIDTVVGAVLTLISFGWSIFTHTRKK